MKNNVANIGYTHGDTEIASIWKAHSNNLINELHDNGSKKQLYDCVNESAHKGNACLVKSVQGVITAVNKQHKNKAAGPDDIKIESFMYLRLW